jgi:hypothetical protein
MRIVALSLSLFVLSAAVGLAADSKNKPDDNKKPTVVQLRDDKTRATVKVGEVVLCGVKQEKVEELRVKVNGKMLDKPKTDRSGPRGAGYRDFVFEAKKPGKYRIEVIPIWEGKALKPKTFDVVVK